MMPEKVFSGMLVYDEKEENSQLNKYQTSCEQNVQKVSTLYDDREIFGNLSLVLGSSAKVNERFWSVGDC